jgi:flagellar basal-body rod protein FlgF
MENPSYIVLSQQMGLRRHMEIIANNLANVNTAGFKAERMMFSEYVTTKASNPGIKGDKAQVSFLGEAGTVYDTAEGPLESTGNQLDFALHGPGYFVVDTPDGQRYTRDGHFELDGTGKLITRDGYTVLGAGNAALTLPADATSIEASESGKITTNKGDVGTLQVVKFDPNVQLRKVGRNLYETDATSQPIDKNTKVQQAMSEASNVQAVLELTRMIDVQRAYQSAQRMLENESDRSRKAIQTLTRIS